MFLEFSKSEKKFARELIEKGLKEEFKKGMLSFDLILQQWKNEGGDVKESYHKIFKAVTNFDKKIGRRYDGMPVSQYMFIIGGQLGDKLYDETELDAFSPQIKNAILFLAGK